MTPSLRQKLSSTPEPVLNRLLVLSAVLLVIAVAGFIIYYNLDRQGGKSPDTLAHDIALYEEEVRAAPDAAGPRLSLAALYYADGRYAESAEQYEAALAIEEGSLRALVGLGRALLASGDQAGAIENFQKVVELTEEAEMAGDMGQAANYYLGSIYIDQGRADEAIPYLEEALVIESADADAWRLLGVAHLESGNVEEAIAALSRAVEFVPNYAEAYESLAVAYERAGLESEARYARGMLAYSQGRLSEAARELEAAHDASPDSVNVLVGFGLILETQGERESAIASYQRALELEPDNFNARAGLARLDVPAQEGATGEEVTP